MKFDKNAPRFRRFVAMRRKWFRFLFAISFVLCALAANQRRDSLVDIAGLALGGALVLATALSLASAPALWMISGKQEAQKARATGPRNAPGMNRAADGGP